MFRNLAIAIVSVCAVSTGSPAWSQQNSPVEPTSPPPPDRQFASRGFEDLRQSCYDNCWGEEARLLFKLLGNAQSKTYQIQVRDSLWLERVDTRRKIECWTRKDDDGDFIVTMMYVCKAWD
jgi:hypothetical protein